ncbi:MAG: cupredoxin domain-containing protein [Candidatus Micrarchaeia archaeon]|jgi:plastocyanin domain-containing protein
MATEKYAFAAIALVALAFIGFVFMNGATAQQDVPAGVEGMQIDETIPETPQGGQQAAPSGEVQVVQVRASSRGYDNPRPVVKAGVPVRFEFSADSSAGCGRQVIVDGFGVNLVARNGETVSATFTPPAPGEYKFHCGMNMFRGVLVAE